jgi:hypothetical protein
VFILERVQVVCFEAGLQVLILRGMPVGVCVGWIKGLAADLARVREGREVLRDRVAGTEARKKAERRRSG